jgi:hypothetical protein
MVLTAGLIGSYVLYYISMRVSPWWVSLSSVGVIWFGALYRAIASPATIVAASNDLETEEHWIGLFRHTLSDSLLATIAGAHVRPLGTGAITAEPSSPSTSSDRTVVSGELEHIIEPDVQKDRFAVLLVINQPVRTALTTWSGAEDIIKVGLEVAKLASQTKNISFASHEIKPSTRWIRIVRMRFAIYIPGLIWRSNHVLDMPLPKDFQLNDIIRHLLKALHVCLDQPGTVSTHDFTENVAKELSHVLCGPVADPPVQKEFTKTTATLRETFVGIRENDRNAKSRKFSIEQTLLLPTIILAATYDYWLHNGRFERKIASLQRKYPDNLTYSGRVWIPTLQRELDRLQVLDDFMVDSTVRLDQSNVEARDETSGNYNVWNGQHGDREKRNHP